MDLSPRSAAASMIDSVMENVKSALNPSESHFMAGPSSSGIAAYGSDRVHDLLGGGHYADVLLWRKKHLSAGFLVGSTVIWLLFEWIGYHFISVISLLLLGVVVILFTWSNGAGFLNRAPPPVPKLQLSDDQVLYIAKTLKVEINRILAILHEIAIGRDLKRFLQLVAHSLPVLYEKHGNTIDRFAQNALNELNNQYKKVDASFLSKIPRKQPSFRRKSD